MKNHLNCYPAWNSIRIEFNDYSNSNNINIIIWLRNIGYLMNARQIIPLWLCFAAHSSFKRSFINHICIEMFYGQSQESTNPNALKFLSIIRPNWNRIYFNYFWEQSKIHLTKMQLTFESTAHNHMLCEMKRKKKKMTKNSKKPMTPLTLKIDLSSKAVTFYRCCLFVSPLKLDTSMLEQFRQFIINECNCLQSA